jgi:DHA1 family tetracycline resistance protein-like MFS transporter
MGFYGPSVQGLMTHRVSASEQGQLQGVNSSIMGITGMIGPAVFSVTFAYFIKPKSPWHLPGAPFLLAAAFLFVAMFVAWHTTRPGHEPAAGD